MTRQHLGLPTVEGRPMCDRGADKWNSLVSVQGSTLPWKYPRTCQDAKVEFQHYELNYVTETTKFIHDNKL